MFVHDAVMYLTRREDLRRAMRTAFAHCRPGGVALFVPDYVRETFVESTRAGGHDGGDGRSLRYVEWITDPDRRDTHYLVDFAYLLRSPAGRVRALHDRHVFGLFRRRDWLALLREVGFRPRRLLLRHSEAGKLEVFLGVRPR